MAARLPRVAFLLPAADSETPTDGVAAATAEAVMRLAERGVVELAPQQPGATVPACDVDLVHTVGSAEQAYLRDRPARSSLVPWVHSLDAPPPARRHRRYTGGRVRLTMTSIDPRWYLVHGHTAWRAALDSGVIPADRTHCAPVVPVAIDALGDPVHVTRRQQRQALGITPGTRVVLGCGPRDDRGRRMLQRAVARLGRDDVATFWIDDQKSGGTSLIAMLLAADVFVATSNRLGAANVGALALDTGARTIAESCDPCAELLSDGRGIVIATDDVAALSTALGSVVDERRRFADMGERHTRRVDQLARSIERLYERALERPFTLRAAG